MRRVAFTALIALTLLSSCRDSRHAAVEALQADTERIHDEAMVELAAMNRTARALKATLAALDSTATGRRDSIVQALAAMDKADADMMAWMAAYEAPENLPGEEAVRYLEAEKLKIEQNHRDIRAAEELGQRLLPPQ